MDFTFSAEQDDFRAAVRTTLAAEAPSAYVRAMIEDPVGVTPELWADAWRTSVGWACSSPSRPAASGSAWWTSSCSRRSWASCPSRGPFCLLGGGRHAGRGPPRGRRCARRPGLGPAPGHGGGGGARPRGPAAPRWRATAARGGRRTGCSQGTKPLVLDGAHADFAFVVAHDGDGPGHLPPRGPGRRAGARPGRHPQDGRGSILDGRRAPPGGPRRGPDGVCGAGCSTTSTWRCAPSWWAPSERALELAVEYAKVRVQFDRPIATFQVIKHKAADMLHHLELARVGTHYAAWASDADDPERERAAAMCKGYVAEAADAVTGRVHPGPRGRGLHLGRRLPPAVPPGQAGRPALRGPGLPAPAPGRPRSWAAGCGLPHRPRSESSLE